MTLVSILKNLFFLLLFLQIAPKLVQNVVKQYGRILEPQTQVACIRLTDIPSSSQTFTKQLKSYFKNKDIKAILLRIDSPGGSAGTSEAIAHEIAILKKKFPKPIITLTENICASGGYMVAATTDYIISAPSALVGSIGTMIPYQFSFEELLKKMNVSYTPITSGCYKGTSDPCSTITPEQKAMLQSVVDTSYAHFIEHIARYRPKLSVQTAHKWAEGRIFNGLQALELGLVDQLGSMSTASEVIKERAVIEGKIQWVYPEQPQSLWHMITGKPDVETSFRGLLDTLISALHSSAATVSA